ncbi:head-tail connector protein [Sutcliffiella horikoshii]|uniref:head-tail connector protein n=1 Tax=Sutcliffiella horikoshii TaxID=79883 RepID=UPI00203EC03E|nr:head-tail connector protein [Sutcliffiella horikoshii]MCM3619165.1 head-tail connector protein [Sutcliffiella horikoshii]
MEISTLKQFLGIEHDEDNTLLAVLVKRAEIYVENQVGTIDKSNAKMKEQYEQACALLVQHWYDNRESFRIGNNSYEIPYSLDSIVRQLKYCYPVGD